MDSELERLDRGLKQLSKKYKSGTRGYCPVWALAIRKALGSEARFVIAWYQHIPKQPIGTKVTHGESFWIVRDEPPSTNHVGVLYMGHVLDADGVSTKEDWKRKWGTPRSQDPAASFTLRTWIEERESASDEEILGIGEPIGSCPYNLRKFEEEIRNLVMSTGKMSTASSISPMSGRRIVRAYRRRR